MRAHVSMAPRASAARGSAQVLDALRKPPAPDPTELFDVHEQGLEAVRDTAVGRAFDVLRAELSRDGRFMRLHLGAERELVELELAPKVQVIPLAPDPGLEVTEASRMAIIMAEPNYLIRSTMLVLEHGYQNGRRALR